MSQKQKLIADIEHFLDKRNKNNTFILNIQISDYPDTEMILNSKENMVKKLDYIKSAYDNNLQLNPKVKIVSWRIVYLPKNEKR